MKERQEDGRFCRAYLRTMDPERAAAEINRRDGYTMLGRKTTQQHLEQMRSAAAATVKREDILRQLAKLAFGGAEDAVLLGRIQRYAAIKYERRFLIRRRLAQLK